MQKTLLMQPTEICRLQLRWSRGRPSGRPFAVLLVNRLKNKIAHSPAIAQFEMQYKARNKKLPSDIAIS